jgi:uncharacterized protein
MISPGFFRTVLQQYALPQGGIHGITHWARVLENGRRLARVTGARIEIIELFAVFHDIKRKNEGWDLEHGYHGAELAAQFRGLHFSLPEGDFDLLYAACCDHTKGETSGDITLQTCWDADRLDLGRAGIELDPRYLCTDAAKDPGMIAWADGRSQKRSIPKLVLEEWALRLEKKK